MSRYLPIMLGIVAIVGLTITQAQMSDRFAEGNFSAEQQATLLGNIPMKIGDWVGENIEIKETVRKTAGAVGAVSRVYRNSRTGDKVDLWLIVGHGRVISAHTPNICYQASGFEMRAEENSLYPMAFPDQPDASPFWTNTFFKNDITGRQLIRVFWSWYNAESEENKGKVVWEAPPNARYHFGNTRALYKMYFTSQMSDQSETADKSACLRFAREFMPIVNEALAQVNLGPGTAGQRAATNDDDAATSTNAEAEDAPSVTADLPGDDATSADAAPTPDIGSEQPAATLAIPE
jgi:hypothetical protein